ncbi:MAG: DUF1343 domain-containing protein [Balneolaceae bacterium]|nr:DUF1343 domain-containing protein [Balneolaceae bacterium]
MYKSSLLFLLSLFICLEGCIKPESTPESDRVKTGAEVVLEQHLDELEGKRVGLVMNPTSRVNGTHMLDTLLSLKVNITALFAAEHGFRGDAGAGEVIENGVDQETGLPVHSLYGSTKKPTAAMLENVDVILFDLPDVGSRFYTYSSTMGYVLEAVTEHDKEMWILDRPNPLGGDYVSGWVLRDEFVSFVGKYPIPINYGMTMGELAQMAVGEEWLELDKESQLKIIKAEGWERWMKWPDTELEWIAPSPNLPTFTHAFIYPATVIFEGTNISEGRGTDDPFLTIGAPTFEFNETELSEIEQKHKVVVDSISFTPRSIPGKAISPKHEGERCQGLRIRFPNGYGNINTVELGLDLLQFVESHTRDFEINAFANKLYGIDIQTIIEQGEEFPSWKDEVAAFKEKRSAYLLY